MTVSRYTVLVVASLLAATTVSGCKLSYEPINLSNLPGEGAPGRNR